MPRRSGGKDSVIAIYQSFDTADDPITLGLGNDNVWKEARLENGVKIMVPPFIAPGELVRVEVASGKYLERAKTGFKAGHRP